jgi:hypothetical protein
MVVNKVKKKIKIIKVGDLVEIILEDDFFLFIFF